MKEQAKEEHVESKEEASRRLVETRRARPVSKPELAPRVKELPPKPQVPPAKPRITFNIPIKSVKQLGISQPQPPRLKAKFYYFVRPRLLFIKAQPTTIIMPTISMAPKTTLDIRVPTFMAITLRKLVMPSLRLRLKPPSDMSVRPIIPPKSINDLRTPTPIITPSHVVFQRPATVPVFLERSFIAPIPTIRLIPFLKEETERRQLAIQLPQPPIVKPEVGVKKVSAEKETKETELELEAEDVLDELLLTLKGKGGREFSLQRPLCLIAVGKSEDGLRMIEHLMATKYTYYGEYRFFMGLPWQKELISSKIAEEMMKKTGVRCIPFTRMEQIKEEEPYSLITSERLIVRIPSVNEENIMEIIRGLKEISKRGPKCVILYTRDVRPLEDLDKQVLDVDVIIVALPEYNERLPRLIERLLGIDLPPTICEESLDDLWSSAVRLYEEEMKRLDNELSTEGVNFFPERESLFHYLMKRIVYWHLKNKNGYARVEAEKLEPLINEANQFVGYVVPDVVADDEYWEVETGYPSEEEKALIMEPWNPRVRLIWKLSKYRGSPSKIRVVFPAIYAHLFRHDIMSVKKYFKERGIDIKFYTIYLHQRGELKRFA